MSGFVFLSCLLFGVEPFALEPAGSWVELGLVVGWRPLGELSLIDIPCGQEFSDVPASWIQSSHPRVSDPTPGLGTKTSISHTWQKRGKKEKKNGKYKKGPEEHR